VRSCRPLLPCRLGLALRLGKRLLRCLLTEEHPVARGFVRVGQFRADRAGTSANELSCTLSDTWTPAAIAGCGPGW
jgi:hypothetical protein